MILVKMSEHWPFNHPVAIGSASVFVIVSACSAYLANYPETINDSEKTQKQITRYSTLIGIVSIILACVVLMISWRSSNKDRYAFLDD